MAWHDMLEKAITFDTTYKKLRSIFQNDVEDKSQFWLRAFLIYGDSKLKR